MRRGYWLALTYYGRRKESLRAWRNRMTHQEISDAEFDIGEWKINLEILKAHEIKAGRLVE